MPRQSAASVDTTEKALDATEHNSVANDGRTFLVFRNKDAAATHTVKLGPVGGPQVGPTFTLAKSKGAVIGPLPVFEVFGTTVEVITDSAEVVCTAISVPARVW
jgi:hypothetical protein